MFPTKTLIIAAINEGTVIDHIEQGQAINIINLLELKDLNYQITLAMNLKSHSQGYKDMIKLEGIRLNENELNKIVIFSPKATVNVINNYEVIEKFKMKLPSSINNLTSCPNLKCISNYEAIESSFYVIQQGKKIQLSCHYCRNNFNQREIFLQTLIKS